MADIPLVSVIIPAYNVQQYVRESVDSALAQTHPRLEIIVVNDGSTDRTGEILSDYGDRIICITQENQGLSAARNRGIREAHGDFIAFLDSDDAWVPTKTAMQLREFQRSETIGLVTCPYFLMDQQSEIFQLWPVDPGPPQDQLDRLLVDNTVGSPSAVIVRRDCLERVGPFDENLVNGSEDWDFYLRIVLAGYHIVKTDEPLLNYRKLENSMSSVKNVDRMLQNDFLVLNKVFAQPGMNGRWWIRRQAYSRRYLHACWSYVEGGDDYLSPLRRALGKSFLYNPSSFLARSQLLLVFHSILGQKRFERIKKVLRHAL